LRIDGGWGDHSDRERGCDGSKNEAHGTSPDRGTIQCHVTLSAPPTQFHYADGNCACRNVLQGYMLV
jgi:hypothetical protein